MGWAVLIFVLYLCGCEITKVHKEINELNNTMERIARSLEEKNKALT